MPDGIAFHTPSLDNSASVICRTLALPSYLWQYFNGAYGELLSESNWVQVGDITIQEIVQTFQGAFDNMKPCYTIGSIVPYAREVLPENVLPCDGSQHATADYPELAGVLHGVYNISKDYFVTPDLRAVFPFGAATVGDVGTTGGSATARLDEENLPPHSHTYTPPTANVDLEAPGAPDIVAAGVGLPTQTGQTGQGVPFSIIPPYHALLWGIVAK